MMFLVLNPVYYPTQQKTANGQPWVEIDFKVTGVSVEAMNDEDAIKFAKRLGFHNPVLGKIKHG